MTQNGDKPDDAGDGVRKSVGDAVTIEPDGDNHTSPPEVEAELVEGASLGGPDSGADRGTGPADAVFDESPDDAEGEQEAPGDASAQADAGQRRLRSTLTPGVILFVIFSIVALGTLGWWWFQSERQVALPATPQPAAASQTVAPGQTPAAPTPAIEDPAAQTLADKLDNSAYAQSKPDAPASQEQASGPDDSFLPPISGDDEKIANRVEEGAKDVMRRFQEADEAADVIPEESPSTDDLVDVDKGSAEDSAQGDESSGADAASAKIGASTAEEPPLDVKIANDVAALKAEFAAQTARLENELAAERQRNLEQADEISALRTDLGAALNAREQALNAELATMRAALEKIQNDDIVASSARVKAGLAFLALRRAVEAGEPYANQLTALGDVSPSAVSVLAPFADVGAPTLTALTNGFGAAARLGLAAAGEKDGASLLTRAKSLISVRPATPQAGDGPRAVISRAEHALGEGDLVYALSQLETLPSPAQSAMADWMGDARAKAEIETALAALDVQLNLPAE